MRFRLGYVSGFATGYYLGSKAGRQRYEQINRSLRKLKRSETFDTATVRAREVLDETVDKAKGLIEKRPGDTGTAAETGAGGETGTGSTNGTATVPSAATASPATAAATDGSASTTPADTGLAPGPTTPPSNAAGSAPYATETPGKNQP